MLIQLLVQFKMHLLVRKEKVLVGCGLGGTFSTQMNIVQSIKLECKMLNNAGHVIFLFVFLSTLLV